MRRLATVLALVGCGSGSSTQTSHVEPRVAPRKVAPVHVGQHAARIALVAATEDGTAAVSQDEEGGTRLWPSLDGTKEPVIVPVDRARDLAMTRTATGFAIVATDEAGGGQIVSLAASGGLVERVKLPPEPAIEIARIRGEDVLLLRADQTIELVSLSGAPRARLEPPSGQRIIGLVSRGSRALAILERDGVFRGRWIEGTAWGATTAQVIAANPIFEGAGLSPSGALLAVPQTGMVSIIDLATAHVEQKRWLHGERVEFVGEERIAAFSDSSLIAAFIDSEVQTQPISVGQSPVALGDRIVSGSGSALALTSPERTQVSPRGVGPLVDVDIIPAKTQYLGYRMMHPASMRLTRDGGVLAGGEQQLVHIARNLKATRTIELSPDPRVLSDALMLDETHILTSHEYGAGLFTLAVFDTRTREDIQFLSPPVLTQQLRYEPATELVAITGADGAYVVRRDARTSKLDTWYRLSGTPTDVQLFDPAQAHGVVAMGVRMDVETKLWTTDLYVADDLAVGGPRPPHETHGYDGTLVTIDARGRVYMRDDEELIVFDRGREILRIPHAFGGTDPEAQALPAPPRIAATGDRIAVLDGTRITLYGTDGKQRWIADGPAPRDIGWMGDTLVGEFDGALARIDARSGRLAGATCGWSFGISDATPLVGREAGALCEAQ